MKLTFTLLAVSMYYVHSWCMGLFTPSHKHELGEGEDNGMGKGGWGMGNE